MLSHSIGVCNDIFHNKEGVQRKTVFDMNSFKFSVSTFVFCNVELKFFS